MTDYPVNDASGDFEEALNEEANRRYVLRLYVAGNTQRSANTILNLRNVCEEYLQGRYQLEIIDIYQHPEMAKMDQIVATPTLVKELPPPIRRIIGDLSEKERVLVGLNLVNLDDGDQR